MWNAATPSCVLDYKPHSENQARMRAYLWRSYSTDSSFQTVSLFFYNRTFLVCFIRLNYKDILCHERTFRITDLQRPNLSLQAEVSARVRALRCFKSDCSVFGNDLSAS